MFKKSFFMAILVAVNMSAFAGSIGQVTVPAGGEKATISLAHEMERLSPKIGQYIPQDKYELNCSINNPKAHNIMDVSSDYALCESEIILNGGHMFSLGFKEALPRGKNSLSMNLYVLSDYIYNSEAQWKDVYGDLNIYMWSKTGDLTVNCLLEKLPSK